MSGAMSWSGRATPLSACSPRQRSRRCQAHVPLTYTPPYLAEKILTSRSALEGERKQVTVLFADIKDSTELIQDLDPEAAQTAPRSCHSHHDGGRAPL